MNDLKTPNLALEFWAQSAAPAWIKSGDGRFVRFNDAYLKQIDPEAGKWLGRTEFEVRPAGIAKAAVERDLAATTAQQPLESIESFRGRGGEMNHFIAVRFPIVSDGERFLGMVALDISAQKKHTDELALLAVTDPLTGLYNRCGYLLLADHELKIARRRKSRCAVLYIDVDGLKAVNDTFGHVEGDVLLAETAILLRDVFRESDVIGRIGGDEFSVFAPDAGLDPDQLKARLRGHIPHFPRMNGQPRPLSLSIGVAVCGPGDHVRLEDLLAAADSALYVDKRVNQERGPEADLPRADGERGARGLPGPEEIA